MVSKDAIVAKELNAFITGFSFVDKSLEDHIYASLSQPPIRIINKNGSDNEMDFTVECPNCKKAGDWRRSNARRCTNLFRCSSTRHKSSYDAYYLKIM